MNLHSEVEMEGESNAVKLERGEEEGELSVRYFEALMEMGSVGRETGSVLQTQGLKYSY